MKAKILISIILCLGLGFCGCSNDKISKRAVLVSDFSDDFETFKKELAECYKVSTHFGIITHKKLTDPIAKKFFTEDKKWQEKQRKALESNDMDKYYQIKEEAAISRSKILDEMLLHQLTDEEGERFVDSCLGRNYSYYNGVEFHYRGLLDYFENQSEYSLWRKGVKEKVFLNDESNLPEEYAKLIKILKEREQVAREQREKKFQK